MVQWSRVASFSAVQRLRYKLANKRHLRRADPEPKSTNMVTTRSQAAAVQAAAQTTTTLDESLCFICQDHEPDNSFTCIRCRYQVCSTCALRNMKFVTHNNVTPSRGVRISHPCPQCRCVKDVYDSLVCIESCGSTVSIAARRLHRAVLWSDFKDRSISSGSFYAPNIAWITPHHLCENFVKCGVVAYGDRLEVSLFHDTMFEEIGNARTSFVTNFKRACTDLKPCKRCDHLLACRELMGEEYAYRLRHESWDGPEPNWRGCTLHMTSKSGFEHCIPRVTYYYDCLHPSCGATAHCGDCRARRVINEPK